MEISKQTKMVAFCCPNHGALQETVEYFSANIGTKRLVDVPVMYCRDCKKYYTPFTNLLAFIQLKYKGYKVSASQGRVEKSIPRVKVRSPYFVDKQEAHPSNTIHSAGGTQCAGVSSRHEQLPSPRRINGYEIVPIKNINQQAIKAHIMLANYSCDECLSCGNRLVTITTCVRVNEHEAIRIPGQYCTKCDAFFDNRGTSLLKVFKRFGYIKAMPLDTQYLFPQYSEKMKYVKSIKSASVAIHIKCAETETHRIITIVSLPSDRDWERDVYHYSDWFARQLLYEIHKQNKSINITGNTFRVLKVFRLDWKNDTILNRLKIDTLILRAGGGLYGGISQKGTELVDILLYSPFTNCLEVAHATFDIEHQVYYMDSKVFRNFVTKYGNPGVKIAAYQHGNRDFISMREESILHAYGYVVGNNGLADHLRCELLAEVMDLDIMSPCSILNLLDLDISMHPGDKYANARLDWETDRKFVLEYKVNPDRFVVASIGL